MMQITRLYDGVDWCGKPFFFPGRNRIDDLRERARVEKFLDSGEIVRRTSGLEVDCIDPSRGCVVPTSSYTDGTWIWNIALCYYVITHGIAPERDFLAHIARCNYEAATPDEPTWRKALQVVGATQQPTL